jgi:hypothetical protein
MVQWQEELAHPMRLHWEYLSYLFRKLPALSANEELERGYRDFLQVLFSVMGTFIRPVSSQCLQDRFTPTRGGLAA